MKFYRISRYRGDPSPVWASTLDDAQEVAGTMLVATAYPGNITIEQVDLSLSQEDVLWMLSGGDPVGNVMWAWKHDPDNGNWRPA